MTEEIRPHWKAAEPHAVPREKKDKTITDDSWRWKTREVEIKTRKW